MFSPPIDHAKRRRFYCCIVGGSDINLHQGSQIGPVAAKKTEIRNHPKVSRTMDQAPSGDRKSQAVMKGNQATHIIRMVRVVGPCSFSGRRGVGNTKPRGLLT